MNNQIKVIKKIIKKIFFFLGFRQTYNNLSLTLKSKDNLKKSNVEKKLYDKVIKIQSRISNEYYKHKLNPKLSLILTSYNHIGNVEKMHKALLSCNADEIIVCDDGSIDGSNEKWRELLRGPNEYLYSSNENHEFMILDRAFLSTRAEILCIMQDDDIPPENNKWISDAIKIFNNNPDLVILGANGGNIFDRKNERFENYNSFGYSKKQREYYNDNRKNIIKRINLGMNKDDIRYMFVHAVNYGPCFIKKDFYLESGGYNLKHIGVGNIAIYMDWELCLRAWNMNKIVGLYEVDGFKRRVGGSRQQVFQLKKRIDQRKKNKLYLENNYSFKFLDEINKRILELNSKLDKF